MLDIRLGCASICKRVVGHHWELFLAPQYFFSFWTVCVFFDRGYFSFNFWKTASIVNGFIFGITFWLLFFNRRPVPFGAALETYSSMRPRAWEESIRG